MILTNVDNDDGDENNNDDDGDVNEERINLFQNKASIRLK